MSWNVLDARDSDVAALSHRTVAVIGYGNQGHAHALNLRDAGVTVTVGQRPGAGWERAVRDGFTPTSAGEAAAAARLIVLALPDEKAADLFADEIAPRLSPGKTLGFIHGFNVRYRFIVPPPAVDCVMIAPKGPGTLLRSLFLQGRGLPALLAIEQDATGEARDTALAWAAGIGAARAGVVETTFAAETECDLFGEQVVLCGGVTALMKAAFETLVDAGYAPELAYLECVHELKQVVDLIYQAGISAMRRRVSNTAEYGDLTRGPRLIDADTRHRMREILGEIRSGAFAQEWMDENGGGLATFQHLFDADRRHAIEQAGEAVRRLMPWLAEPDP